MPMDPLIKHDEKEGKFFFAAEEGECSLRYIRWSDKLWDFVSTFSSENLRKKENKLIEYALTFARKNNIRIKATSDEVQRFLIENKQFRSVLYYPY